MSELVERLREVLESHAALLEVIADDALRANDITTWTMASVMAEKGRETLALTSAIRALAEEVRK